MELLYFGTGYSEMNSALEAGRPAESHNWGWCTEFCDEGEASMPTDSRKLKVVIFYN